MLCSRDYGLDPKLPWQAAAAKVEARTPYVALWGDGTATAANADEAMVHWKAAKSREKQESAAAAATATAAAAAAASAAALPDTLPVRDAVVRATAAERPPPLTSAMQSFVNATREKVGSGRGAEPLDVAGLRAARAADAAATGQCDADAGRLGADVGGGAVPARGDSDRSSAGVPPLSQPLASRSATDLEIIGAVLLSNLGAVALGFALGTLWVRRAR